MSKGISLQEFHAKLNEYWNNSESEEQFAKTIWHDEDFVESTEFGPCTIDNIIKFLEFYKGKVRNGNSALFLINEALELSRLSGNGENYFMFWLYVAEWVKRQFLDLPIRESKEIDLPIFKDKDESIAEHFKKYMKRAKAKEKASKKSYCCC